MTTPRRPRPGTGLFDWFRDVAITSSCLGLSDVNTKRSQDFGKRDRHGTTQRRWSMSRACPVKFVAGNWDNEGDEDVIESMTLTYDLFEPVQ